jgi:RNA polymerase sigma-70 factor (ECF subfamily)
MNDDDDDSFVTDQQYVGECLNGHPDRYRHLAKRYERVLMSHLLSRCRGDRCEAEEAAQEALVRAYFWLPSLKKRASFFSWLIGIADRVALEQQRARARERRLADTVAEARRAVESSPPPHAAQPIATEPDDALRRAIAALPEEYRRLIQLRYYSDLSCGRIAEQLGMPLGTVTKTLSRAYVMLRETLSDSSEVRS